MRLGIRGYELDNFYMAYESLLNQNLPDSKINEYKSYVKEARIGLLYFEREGICL